MGTTDDTNLTVLIAFTRQVMTNNLKLTDLSETDKLHKAQILAYLRTNKLNFQSLLQMDRTDFTFNVVRHSGNFKVRDIAAKVYDALIVAEHQRVARDAQVDVSFAMDAIHL